jgi:hypothetical protein
MPQDETSAEAEQSVPSQAAIALTEAEVAMERAQRRFELANEEMASAASEFQRAQHRQAEALFCLRAENLAREELGD